MRLARSLLPQSDYGKDESSAPRSWPGAVAVRNADVMVATTELLADRFAKRLPSATFDFVRNAQEQHRAGSPDGEHGEALRAL